MRIGGQILVGWLSGIRTQSGIVATKGILLQLPCLRGNALQLRKNHGKTSVKWKLLVKIWVRSLVKPKIRSGSFVDQKGLWRAVDSVRTLCRRQEEFLDSPRFGPKILQTRRISGKLCYLFLALPIANIKIFNQQMHNFAFTLEFRATFRHTQKLSTQQCVPKFCITFTYIFSTRNHLQHL